MLNLFKKAKRAFTLVEISVTLAVIAVLLAVFIPSFSLVQTQAMVTTMRDQMVTGYNAIKIQDGMDGSFEYSNGVILAKSVNSNKLFYTIVKNGRPMETEYVTDRAKHEWTANVFYGVPSCPNTLTAKVEDGKVIIYADENIENNSIDKDKKLVLTTVQAAHVVFNKESKLNKAGRGGVLPDMPIQKNDNGLISSVKFISTGNYNVEKVVFDGIEEGRTVGTLTTIPVDTQDAPTHKYVYSESSTATCTEAGYRKGYCVYCKDVDEQYAAALGHSWQNGEGIEYSNVAPTCTKDGTNAGYFCTRCNEYFDLDGNKVDTLIVPMTGHEYVLHNKIEPTCTEDGHEAYRTCAKCDYTEDSDSLILPATGHNYTSVVTNPTCTEQGYTTYTCSKCGNTYENDYVDALEHDYRDTVYQPTCTSQGYTTHTCSRCNDKYNDSYQSALGHDPSSTTYEDAGTCVSKSATYNRCTRCYTRVNVRYGSIDSSNHVNTVELEAKPATCDEYGYTAGTRCRDCETTISGCDELRPLGHNGDTYVEKEATCLEAGRKAFDCVHCGKHITIKTPIVEHDWNWHFDDPDTWILKPSCTSYGAAMIRCDVCGYIPETSVSDFNAKINQGLTWDYISPLGHAYEIEAFNGDTPCCFFETYTCARCSYSYIEGEGHAWVEVGTNSSGTTIWHCVRHYTDELGYVRPCGKILEQNDAPSPYV